MLKLEDIQKDSQVQGIDPNGVVRIISADKTGDNAITVIYKDGQGRLGERMLFRTDEPSLSIADKSVSWGFDAPGGSFKLGVEALRIHLAYLFDPMMAIHTSNVDPLSAKKLISRSKKKVPKINSENIRYILKRYPDYFDSF